MSLNYLDPEKIVRDALSEGLRPDPLLTVSDWADGYRFLSTKASAEPGRYRTARTPYLKDVMDALSTTTQYEDITIMKGAQVGASEGMLNGVGYVIDYAPGPILVVQPSLKLAQRFSKQRLSSLIDECPSIQQKVSSSKSRDSSNTILSKEFLGGILLLAGANSATDLRSMPIRYLFLDEIDAYPIDVGGEGDPIDLAVARTRTFSQKKIFKISTPTESGRSKIERAFLKTDQRYYHVPCPKCGHMQVIEWPRIVYDRDENGDPVLETVRLKCEDCEFLIPESKKTTMLNNGKWIPTMEKNVSKKRIGFHLSSLYSPLGWYSWADAVQDWHEAQKDIDKLKSFVNTVLGESWKDKGEAPDWRRLYERRESYKAGTVPDGGLFLTAAVDVQKNRLEAEVIAWGRNFENWSVWYDIIHGDTSQDEVWMELDHLIAKQFVHSSGVKMVIQKCAIDSGYNTQRVYEYCRNKSINKVFAIKGSSTLQSMVGMPKNVDVNWNGRKISNGTRVFGVGIDVIKHQLYGWLRQEKPTKGEVTPVGYAHFPEYGEEYFKMLTAEELRQTKSKGFVKYHWEKIRDRNEALDLRVYNRAAANLCGIDRFGDEDWERLEEQLEIAKKSKKSDNVVATPKRKIKFKKSDYL